MYVLIAVQVILLIVLFIPNTQMPLFTESVIIVFLPKHYNGLNERTAVRTCVTCSEYSIYNDVLGWIYTLKGVHSIRSLPFPYADGQTELNKYMTNTDGTGGRWIDIPLQH